MWQKVCYGMGDFAQNGTYQFVAYYLLYFYTDEMQCSVSVINAALIAGRAVDAVATPAVGSLIDRISGRKPRCRIFFFCAGMCLNVILPVLFFVPAVSDGTVRLWLIFIYSAYSLSYAASNVPYSVMMSSMTSREDERYSLNIFKNIGANLGGAFVSVMTLPMVANLGENGFFRTALFYAVIFAVCTACCTRFTREMPAVPAETAYKEDDCGCQVLTLETICQVFRNRAWVMLILIQFFGCTANILHAQSMVYYAKYCLGNEGISTLLIAMGPLTAAMATFYLPAAARRIGLWRCMAVGNLIMAASLAGIFLSGKDPVLVTAMQFCQSTGWAWSTGLIFVAVTDAVDRQEQAAGKRPQGFMVSGMSLMMKLGSLFGAALGTLILDRAGYTGGSAGSSQMLAGIRIEFIWLPALLALLSGVLAMGFKTEKEHSQNNRINTGKGGV